MSTYCYVVQVPEPQPDTDLEVTDDGGSEAITEGGALALTVDVDTYSIVFATEKTSADYDFTEADVSNTVDNDPLIFTPTMTDRTVDGFTMTIDGLPDTANYIFRWLVSVTST